MTSIIQSNCAFHWFYFSGDIFAGDRHFLFKIVTLHGISWFFAGDRHRMPSRGLYLISTYCPSGYVGFTDETVSMPSRAYTSFLLQKGEDSKPKHSEGCQCPLGLIPHFYMSGRRDIFINFYVSMPSRAYTSFLRGKNVTKEVSDKSVNALSGLYLISTEDKYLEEVFEIPVSMPSRAYTSFLQ